MKVYKYFNKKYKIANSLGLFYINTFANIRKGENGPIYDKTEGKVYNYSGSIFINNKNRGTTKMLADLSACGILIDNTSSIEIENCHFHTELDNYMYCVAKERNDK